MWERDDSRERRDVSGRTALLFGVLIGGVFIVTDVVASYPSGNTPGVDSLLALARVLAVLGAPIWAGWRAARASGGVGSGVFAGSVAGGIGGLLWGAQLVLLPDFAPLAATQLISIGSLQETALCSIPLFAGIGAVTGLLGGWIGAAQFKRAQQAARAEKAAQRRAERDR